MYAYSYNSKVKNIRLARTEYDVETGFIKNPHVTSLEGKKRRFLLSLFNIYCFIFYTL